MAPELAEALYGTSLETSVSRLEEYAQCPFRFFVTSGLRAEERTRFRVDVRQQGSFQHEVLARFHNQLQSEGKRWRDLSAKQARTLIGRIARDLIPEYENGLLMADAQSQFTARALTLSLQSFIATLIDWMPQYCFDPHAVELAFGIDEKPLPAWEIQLSEGHQLAFRGKIDRIDLWRRKENNEALCVVMDYKSSAKRLDPILMAHGVQLQLPAYLNVLRSLRSPQKVFGVERLIPAGVFFVNLRGRYELAQNRREAVAGALDARLLAYQHTGRFDAEVLPYLDCRAEAVCGDQFNYRRTKTGELHGTCREPLSTAAFGQMLDAVDSHLKKMGEQIFAGTVKPDPYRKGNVTACDRCDYAAICRIDPWTHVYRVLN